MGIMGFTMNSEGQDKPQQEKVVNKTNRTGSDKREGRKDTVPQGKGPQGQEEEEEERKRAAPLQIDL